MKMKVLLAILMQCCEWAFARKTFQLEEGLFALLPTTGNSTAVDGEESTEVIPEELFIKGPGSTIEHTMLKPGSDITVHSRTLLPGYGQVLKQLQELNKSQWKFLSEDAKDTNFLLYSHKFGIDAPEYLEFGNMASVTKSQFDPNKRTKVITHGFTMGPTSCAPRNIIEAYLSLPQKDFNLIVVDWATLAIPKLRYVGAAWYASTALNAVKVGERTGDFLVWLHNQSLVELERLHLLGFSLGAHVVGRAGAQVKAKLGKSVGRITGLDPAGPLFYTGIFARRLSPKDAKYVDVIHTNSNGFGMWGTTGQVDFFVNGGGGFQPGCVTFEAQVTILANIAQGIPVPICSHVAVTKLYADSIMSGNSTRARKDFSVCPCPTEEAAKTVACPCEKMVTFGEYSTPGTRGKIFVTYKKNMYQECKGTVI